jgi:two-component system NtrC family sensor kinase
MLLFGAGFAQAQLLPTRYLIDKAASYLVLNRDSAYFYADQGLKLAELEANDTLAGAALMVRGEALYRQTKFDEARRDFSRRQRIAYQQSDHLSEAKAWTMLGECLLNLDSLEDAAGAFDEAFAAWQAVGDQPHKAHALLRKGRALELQTDFESARLAYFEGLKIARRSKSTDQTGLAQQYLGYLYIETKEYDLAVQHLRLALLSFEQPPNPEEMAVTYRGLAKVSILRQKFGVGQGYAESGLQLAKEVGSRGLMMDFYQQLGDIMAGQGNFEQATDFYQLNALIRDSLTGNAGAQELSEVVLQYEKEKAILEKEKAVQENELQNAQLALRDAELVRQQTWSKVIFGGMIAALLFLGFLIYAFAQKNKANRKLQQALLDLNTAQDQLVRSEKLASLGQVTAGIAHEIRNPLNFVNNLSKLSVGMVDELREELHEIEGQPLDPPKVRLLMEYFSDIRGNAQKVLEHGERASRIVRDMLQHSALEEADRTEFEVNDVVEEYLKVAFHSQPLRSDGGKSSNCDMVFEGDPKAGKIKALRPEIGRALLNIMVNAFEAVLAQREQTPANYQPQVHVRTEHLPKGVRITIRDNGPGISAEDQQKIFDPFFTTKPPNRGTGLGLSLAHEAIVRKHKGKIEMDSKAGEGTVFRIFLPVA